MSIITDEEYRTLTREQISLRISERFDKAKADFSERMKEAGMLLNSHIRADSNFRRSLQDWQHHGDPDKWKGFREAFFFALVDDVTTYHFLRAAKLLVIEDRQWSKENFEKVYPLKRTRWYTLNSPEMKEYLERTGEDYTDEDAAEDARKEQLREARQQAAAARRRDLETIEARLGDQMTPEVRIVARQLLKGASTRTKLLNTLKSPSGLKRALAVLEDARLLLIKGRSPRIYSILIPTGHAANLS